MKRWSLKMRLCCKVFDRLNKQRVQIEHRGVLMSSGSSGAAPQMCNSPWTRSDGVWDLWTIRNVILFDWELGAAAPSVCLYKTRLLSNMGFVWNNLSWMNRITCYRTDNPLCFVPAPALWSGHTRTGGVVVGRCSSAAASYQMARVRTDLLLHTKATEKKKEGKASLQLALRVSEQDSISHVLTLFQITNSSRKDEHYCTALLPWWNLNPCTNTSDSYCSVPGALIHLQAKYLLPSNHLRLDEWMHHL